MDEAPLPFSAAAERNGPPLMAELQRLLPAQGRMLEVASGTGQHAERFAAGLSGWTWQPTEADETLLPAIRTRCGKLPNVQAPLHLDLLAAAPAALPAEVDAVFCANLIHISPWACTQALLRLAAQRLMPGGLLLTYGPYWEDAVAPAPSNVEFDTSLRLRNAAWGIRRREAVAAEAAPLGLRLRERVLMPANNLLLAWERF